MTQPITPVTGGVVSSPDTQTAIWFLGVLSQVRLSGEQTGGAFSVTARRTLPHSLKWPLGTASPSWARRPTSRSRRIQLTAFFTSVLICFSTAGVSFVRA